MTSRELRIRLAHFLSSTAESSELMKILGAYETVYSNVPEGAARIMELSKPEELQAEASKLRTALITKVREIREISPRKAFLSLRDLEAGLAEIGDGAAGLGEFSISLLLVVREFADAFDDFLKGFNSLPTVRMLSLARDLKGRIELTHTLFEGMVAELAPVPRPLETDWSVLFDHTPFRAWIGAVPS